MNPQKLGRHLAAATLALGVLSLAGKLLGMVREMVVAQAYGAGKALDAFFIGIALPDLFSFVALYVALNLFIPLYLEVREKDPAAAQRFAGVFLTRATVVLLGLSILVAVLADPLVRLVAPELDAPTHKTALATLRLLSLIIVLRGLQGALRGLLNARRSFALPMAAAISTSVVVIVIVLLLGGQLGVWALSLGILLGEAFSMLVLLAVAGWRIKSLRRPAWHHPAMAIVRRRLPWFVAIESLGLALPLVDRALANRYLEEGAISALSLARILCDVPFQVIALTLAVALFPELASLRVRGDGEGFRKLLRHGVRGVLAVLVPAAAMFVAVHEPLVRAVYERGAFDAADTGLTASALWAFAIGLPFSGVAALAYLAAYAAGRYHLLLGVRLGLLVVKILLSWLLIPVLGHVGLALATSVYHAVLAIALIVPTVGSARGLLPRPLPWLGSSLIAAATAWALTRGYGILGMDSGLGPLLGQAVAWLGGGGVFVLLSRWTGLEEVRWAERMIREKLKEVGAARG